MASILLPTLGEPVPVTSPEPVVYPAIEEVVLKNAQPILATRYVNNFDDISLSSGVPTKIVSVTFPAQSVECVATFQVVASYRPDAKTGITHFGKINGVNTDMVSSYMFDSRDVGGNNICIPIQGQSASILPGTPIVVEIYGMLFDPTDIRTVAVSLNVMLVPTPLLT